MRSIDLKLMLFSFIRIGVFIFLGIQSVYSMTADNKLWSVASVTASIPNDPSFKYYLEPQLRLIEDPYVFNQLFLTTGLGYEFKKNMAIFLGPTWILDKTKQGVLRQEFRLWQQFNWVLNDSPLFSLHNRTRLEERKLQNNPDYEVRLRERLWARVPFKKWENYSLSFFNEIFINLNHPQWRSPYVFTQNRTFIGISTPVIKTVIFDVGYLNQSIYAYQNQLNHVLLLSFTVSV